MSASLLNRGQVRAEFSAAIEALPFTGLVDSLAISYESMNASERQAFLGSAPRFRERQATRAPEHVTAYKMDIENKTYDAFADIDEDDLADDTNGQFNRMIGELAESAARLPYELMIETMVAGNTSAVLSYDGQNFYSATHSLGASGTQTNLLTATEIPTLNVATANAPTPEEIIDVLVGGAAYQMRYLDDKGRPMNQGARRFLAVVPMNMFASGLTALYTNNLAAGRTNTIIGAKAGGYEFDIIGEPTLTADTVAFLHRVDGRTRRPFIVQRRRGFRLQYFDESSDMYKLEGKYAVRADWRGRVHQGEPLHSVRMTFS